MDKLPKKQLVLMVDDDIYSYLKIKSVTEGLPMNAIVTVLVEEDMINNEHIVKNFLDYIFKNHNG
jgi:hypothetical protein